MAAVSYGLCSSQSEDLQQRVPSSLYKKLIYLVPRLVAEARAEPGAEGHSQTGHVQAGGGAQEQGVWSRLADPTVTLTKSVLELWRYGPFRSLQTLPDYQLSFPEWLAFELQVQRSQDALSDPQRQDYERWVCEQLYLPTAVAQGGCGGDVQRACTLIINTLMDTSTVSWPWQSPELRVPLTDTCLPDVLSRLQEMVCELQMTLRFRTSGGADGHFLFDVVAGRCSKTPDSQDLGNKLSLQQTLHTWNRVILALPALSLIPVRSEGARRTLDCEPVIQHMNQYQRKSCSPAGLLPYPLTAHFLRGIIGASASCERPAAAINRAMSQINQQCPLLAASAGVNKHFI